MSLYYPNSANCTASGGRTASRPRAFSLGMFQEEVLDAAELNTISTDDENNHLYTGNGNGYVHHRLKFTITEDEGDVTQIDYTLKGLGDVSGAPYQWYTYILDDTVDKADPAGWIFQDSHTNSVKTTLTGTVAAAIPNFINASKQIYVDVYGPTDFFAARSRLYFAELEITTGGGPPAGGPGFWWHNFRESGLITGERRLWLPGSSCSGDNAGLL